jgi:hypothetical protein
MKKISIFSGIMALALPVIGECKTPIESVYFNAGLHTEFYNKIQNDTSGNFRKFDYGPTFGGGLQLPVYKELRFLPEFNWVLPRNTDGAYKNLFMLRGDLSYDPSSWLRVRLGTSLMLQNYHGKGGTVNVNNGNDVSTFYYPDENRTSINNTFDLGIEAMYDDFSLRLQTYTYSLFKEERRQISYTIFLSYYYDLERSR